jgi:hypothetical protein
VYGVEYEIEPTFLDDFYAYLLVRLDQRQHHNANRSHKGEMAIKPRRYPLQDSDSATPEGEKTFH